MFKPLTIASFFQSLASTRLWLGFSGGLDSQVLLHAIIALIDQRQIPFIRAQLHAVHIDHNLNPQAQNWEQHCRQTCHDYNVTFHSVKVDAKAQPGNSPEAYARQLRYAELAKFIALDDVLLTAHHQDDQAETLLLQLFRGAGVKGLASMPSLKPFAKGWHLRPLLPISRAELTAYADAQSLKWVDDDSNADTRFTRNFLRQTIMPALRQRWPQLNAAIRRTATHCAEAATLIDCVAQEDFAAACGRAPQTLSLRYLLTLTTLRQKNVLRYWLNQFKLTLPSTVQLQHILRDIFQSGQAANPVIHLPEYKIRRYQDDIFITTTSTTPPGQTSFSWVPKTPLVIPGIGSLSMEPTCAQGIRADILLTGKLEVRFRQHGERCRPVGRQGSHPLKKLLQEWRIPPWQRNLVPLLYCDNALIAVIGYCICEGFAAQAEEPGFLIKLQSTPAL